MASLTAIAGARALWDRMENPVLGREFRSRMRGARSYLITGGYALAVGAAVLAVYAWAGGASGSVASNQAAAALGRAIWAWGTGVQAFLLPLVVPAFTCGAITMERERDLLELLLLTRQSPLQICVGKLGSGVGLGLSLVLSSVPALMLSLMLGGVSPGEMAATVSVLVTSVFAAGALGLAASAFSARTTAATLKAYLVVGGGLIGLPLMMQLLSAANRFSQAGAETELGILLMLGACMLAAFPPAIGLAFVVYSRYRKRHDRPPPRVWWIGNVGLCWSAVLLFLRLPGMAEVLLQGEFTLFLHPVLAIVGVMQRSAAAARPVYAHLWWLCSLVYCGAAGWLLLLSVLRVRTLRSG